MRRPPGHHTRAATWQARRAEAVELRHLGWTYKRIARHLRVSISCVRAAELRHAETKSFSDRARSGRPRKATPAVVKKTIRLLRSKKSGTYRKTRARLRGQGIDLSHGTIHNIAHRAGLRSSVRVPKPKLTPEHQAARLAWARERKNDDDNKIQRLVFVDEKQFRVHDVTHRVWLYPWEPTPVSETGNQVAFFLFFFFSPS